MNSIEELHAAIDQVAELTNEQATLQAAQDEEIITVKHKRGPRLDEIKKTLKSLTTKARNYVGKHKASVLGTAKQSRETQLARYGFRKGAPTIKFQRGKKEAEVIALLKEKHPRTFAKVAVQAVEILNKEALKTMSDDDLREIGLQRTGGNTFFINPKQDQDLKRQSAQAMKQEDRAYLQRIARRISPKKRKALREHLTGLSSVDPDQVGSKFRVGANVVHAVYALIPMESHAKARARGIPEAKRQEILDHMNMLIEEGASFLSPKQWEKRFGEGYVTIIGVKLLNERKITVLRKKTL